MPALLHKNKILLVVFITIFIDMLGIGILVPVFPMLVVADSPFRVTPLNWSIQSGFVMAGWLMAAYPLAQFLCTPLLGQIADKFGRRRVLLISISGTMLSYILFAIAILKKDLYLLFIARILDGCSGGNISVAQAIIGDISVSQDRARNFGLIGVALGLGFVFGPFLGGKLSDSGVLSWFTITTPFIFASILSLVNIIMIVFLLPETLRQPSKSFLNFVTPFSNIIKGFSLHQLKGILPVLFMFNAGFTFFTTFWGIILADKYEFKQGQIGDFFAYMGIMIILAQGLVVRRLSGRVKDFEVLRYSIIATGGCLLAYYFIPSHASGLIYIISPFLAVFVALTKAFSLTLITRVSPETIRGEIMGINSSANALAQSIPALLAGYIAAYHTTLPILAGSLATLIGGFFFLYISKNYRPDS